MSAGGVKALDALRRPWCAAERGHHIRHRGLPGEGFLLKAGVGEGALRMWPDKDRCFALSKWLAGSG